MLLVPTRREVSDRLVQLTSEIAKIPADRITETATIDEDLCLESVTFIELQVAIEEEYQVEIDPIRVLELNQFGAIAEYVYRVIVENGGG